LAEQDPLINLHQNSEKLFVSLYGEVQKEVIQATLTNDFGIEVTFHKTTPICIERPAGKGSSQQLLQEMSNPTSATVGLIIEPSQPKSGVNFLLNVNPRLVPLHIYKTSQSFKQHMLQYIRDSLKQGLHGWQVTDCRVTMNLCDYYVGDGPRKPIGSTPATTAADFRKLTPIVLRAALKQAETVICEPIMQFKLETPAETLGTILPVILKLHGTVATTEMHESSCNLTGTIPAAQIHKLQQQLLGLTSGEGVLENEFGGYEAMRN